MRKIELLCPASSLEVLKIAVIYGADAVYIGGEAFGLRAKAKNFSMEEMAEGAEDQAALVEKYGIGERICVIGELKRFRHPGNPGEFDYAAYYHAQGYGGQMYGSRFRRPALCRSWADP